MRTIATHAGWLTHARGVFDLQHPWYAYYTCHSIDDCMHRTFPATLPMLPACLTPATAPHFDEARDDFKINFEKLRFVKDGAAKEFVIGVKVKKNSEVVNKTVTAGEDTFASPTHVPHGWLLSAGMLAVTHACVRYAWTAWHSAD